MKGKHERHAFTGSLDGMVLQLFSNKTNGRKGTKHITMRRTDSHMQVKHMGNTVFVLRTCFLILHVFYLLGTFAPNSVPRQSMVPASLGSTQPPLRVRMRVLVRRLGGWDM